MKKKKKGEVNSKLLRPACQKMSEHEGTASLEVNY